MKLLLIASVALMTGWGCATHSVVSGSTSLATARFFLECDPSEGVVCVLPQSDLRIPVAPKPVLTEFDVTAIEIVQVELGRCLAFRLTPAAARDLYRLSVAHTRRRIVLRVDGQAMGARMIDGPIDGGSLLMFVEKPDDALPQLQTALNSTATTLQHRTSKL